MGGQEGHELHTRGQRCSSRTSCARPRRCRALARCSVRCSACTSCSLRRRRGSSRGQAAAVCRPAGTPKLPLPVPKEPPSKSGDESGSSSAAVQPLWNAADWSCSQARWGRKVGQLLGWDSFLFHPAAEPLHGRAPLVYRSWGSRSGVERRRQQPVTARLTKPRDGCQGAACRSGCSLPPSSRPSPPGSSSSGCPAHRSCCHCSCCCPSSIARRCRARCARASIRCSLCACSRRRCRRLGAAAPGSTFCQRQLEGACVARTRKALSR